MVNGGKIAMLGIMPGSAAIDWNLVVFHGLTIKGIYGREMFETWYKMTALIQSGLDISPVITHRFPYREFKEGDRADEIRELRQDRARLEPIVILSRRIERRRTSHAQPHASSAGWRHSIAAGAGGLRRAAPPRDDNRAGTERPKPMTAAYSITASTLAGRPRRHIFLHLAGGGFRELGQKRDSLWRFEVRQMGTSEIPQFGLGDGYPRFHYHKGMRRFAPNLVGTPTTATSCTDGWRQSNTPSTSTGRNVFAPTNDYVFKTVTDFDISVRMDYRAVAGVKLAIADGVRGRGGSR